MGASVIAHGAVLACMHATGPDALPHGAVRPMHLVARVLTPRPPSHHEPTQLPQPSEPAPVPDLGPVAAAAATPAARVLPPATTEPLNGAPVVSTAPDQDPPYLPRGQLTTAPKLLEQVEVPFPDDVQGVVHLSVQITLFIDEAGRVQRIRVDAPQQVHPAFERVIRQAWLNARFAPGELHQVPVRSRLRLEVDFEAPGGRRS